MMSAQAGAPLQGRVTSDLGRFLDEEVIPRLTPEAVFTHTSHKFQRCGHKLRGGCPWHVSKSGTSFYVDSPTLRWRCAGCQVGGGPLQYLHRLQGGGGQSPRGREFVELLRDLAQRAGLDLPEIQISPEAREAARNRAARRSILESLSALCEETLWSAAGEAARAHLHARGFTDNDLQDLEVGLYPELTQVWTTLRACGHEEADIKRSGAVFAKMVGYAIFPWRDDRGALLTVYGHYPAKTPPETKPKKMALRNPRHDGVILERTKRSPLYLDRALRAGHLDLELVEGVLDAALLQVRGRTQVVACVAAELSGLQVQTLANSRIRSVTVALDPDGAGANGVASCVRQLIAAGVTPYVAPTLPDGLDPDEFVIRDGIERWAELVAGRIHGYRHHARALAVGLGERTADDDAWCDQLIESAMAYARSQPTERSEELTRHFFSEIAAQTGSNVSELRALLTRSALTANSNLHHRFAVSEESNRSNADPVMPPTEDAEKAPSAEQIQPNEAIDDPYRLARIFLAENSTTEGSTLRWWRDDWMRWHGSAYARVPDKEIKAELARRAKREFDDQNRTALRECQSAANHDNDSGKLPVARKVTVRLVGDTALALASQTLLRSTVEAPTWLEGNPFPAAEIMACRNTLIHLPAWAAGREYRHPLTPRFFSVNALDYDYLYDAPPPDNWLDFLGRVWPDDPSVIDALQEWFGYCLLPDASQQKIAMIVGPKRSGKGTIARVLGRLVGLANVCAPTLAGLGTNFGLWPLLGKTVAVISDARMSGRTDAAVVVERLLSISGEDALTIDRKNQPHITARLPVRFLIMTNELPRLHDTSGALVGRLVVLRMTRSWYGNEDTGLTERLLGELSGILLWAMEGWKRLHLRGHFIQPESARGLLTDMEDLASPISAFIREYLTVAPGLETPVRDLFAAWQNWSAVQGRKDAGTAAVFGRDLRASLPGLEDHQRRLPDGERVRVYSGVGLRQQVAVIRNPFD